MIILREIMKAISCLKKFAMPILFLLLAITFGCVESLTDIQTSSATPSIDVFSPKTNDSVKVGKNPIYYQAYDGAGGQGLSFYELYVNKVFVKKYPLNTNGTNPIIYLEVDSTLIRTRINYSLKVYNTTGRSKESILQENIYVKDKVPNAPTNLILSRLNDFTVILKWDDNSSNETGFELFRKDVGNGIIINYRKIKTVSANTITTTDGSLSPYVDYYYLVRAINESGGSEFSDGVSTTSLGGGPWNLQAEAIGASLVKLTWIDFAINEQGFQIERIDPTSNFYKILTIVGPNVSEYDDYFVTPSSSYKYRVAYFTLTTQSGYSNEASISTFYTDVLPPSDFSAVFIPGLAVKLKWTDNSKGISKGTIIERKLGSNGQFFEIGTTASDEFEFFDFSFSSSVTYFYRIRQKLGNKIFTPYSVIIRVDIP
jgi:hypothetical protein